ncbi:dTDP-4-dehydrorhamnose reductase [Maribacter dokdonensis]|uniref:dTDP-4-dehydrorhamnose reductase n=1 Tax=Maribacter dokdonensis TaxID=320912 RepID=UPI001B1593AC|nr:dTDP-4-dehydrorhamnose reductase [Maribacter dokdonensis]CAG2534657.1 dTDP-4-dehydrorhamnose reductase [Maribacter dokdonensis]
MKKVLVTGAFGQLGLSIQDIHLQFSNLKFYFFNSKQLDITQKQNVNDVFSQVKFNYCINCAAYTNVEQAEKTPKIAYEVNSAGVENLAIACRNNNVVLIHISTDYVFDGNKKDSYTVEDVPNPINEYGKSKLLGENYIQQILDQYFIIRTSWLYSKTYGKNFYKTILEKAKIGGTLHVTDKQIGCPTSTLNLAFFIINNLIENKTNFGILHFTDEKVMTWYQFADNIITENKLQDGVVLLKAENYLTFAKRPINSILK